MDHRKHSRWRRSTRQRRAGRHVNGWKTAGPPVAKPPRKPEACYHFSSPRVWMEGPRRVASFYHLLFLHGPALSSSVDTVGVKKKVAAAVGNPYLSIYLSIRHLKDFKQVGSTRSAHCYPLLFQRILFLLLYVCHW